MWAQLITTRMRPDLDAARSAMAGLYEGAPEFTDLTVLAEWAD